jgi:ABC-type polysaccharide/polyol phosphate export permease
VSRRGLPSAAIETETLPPHSETRALPRRHASQLDVLWALTRSDMRARYGRGPWQTVKWLVDPFALVGVYLLLVTVVLDRGGPAPALSLACAVISFQLIIGTTMNGLTAVKLRRSIVLNMDFPRALLPASAALTETVAFVAALSLLGVTMAAYGILPTMALLWLPVVVATNVVLAVAFAYPAALFGLWFEDLRAFAFSFVRTMFFVAPGLVPLSEIPGRAAVLVKLNPLSGLFEAYRSAVLYGTSPEAWQLLVPLAFAAVVAAIFVPLFRAEAHQLAKVVE